MTKHLPDHWFYGDGGAVGETVAFSPGETVHAVKSLRLRAGDRLQWLDGRGGSYVGDLTTVTPGSMTACVLSQKRHPPPPSRKLAVGILHDPARVEWLCEKATELGATNVTLLQTERVERARYKLARVHTKTVAALKQSRRYYLPSIDELDISAFIEACASDGGSKLIAHCYGDIRRTPLRSQPVGLQDLTLMIGPEGDFTREEVAQAVDIGFSPVSLGPSRLRTETAALAALSYWSLR